MLIDRTHTRWIIASVLILLVSSVLYLLYAANELNGPSGNSWTGLTFGIIGTFFILITGGIGLRKKFRTWRLGRAQTWMRAHIWLGLLSFPMILFHSGFDFGPRGSRAWTMMWLFVIIILSGIFGLVLQNILPRMLTTQVRRETVFDQIETVSEQLRWEADWLISGVCGIFEDAYLNAEQLREMREEAAAEKEHKARAAAAKKAKEPPPPARPKAYVNPGKKPDWRGFRGVRNDKVRAQVPKVEEGSEHLKDFYVSEIQPYLAGEHRKFDSEVWTQSQFQRVRTLSPPGTDGRIHVALEDLGAIVTEKRQLTLQQRIHNWLHYWLLVHGPLSWAMMTLTAVHAFMALSY